MKRTLPVAPRWLRYAGVAACAVAILAASVADPGDAVPATLFGIETTVYMHVLAYAGLTGAIGYALLSAGRRALMVAAVAAILYGVGIELLQGAVPYRTMSALDVLVNGVGVTLGALLWRAVAPWFGTDAGTTRLSGSTRYRRQ